MADLDNELLSLRTEAEKQKIAVSDKAIERFRVFTESLLKWNEVMNLTAITDPHDIMIKHYLDSIYPLSLGLIKPGDSIIDVGCGAGFPGLPLKFTEPGIMLTLLDSLNKRINFLNSVLTETGIEKVNVICGRAEETANNKQYREKYDIAVSRAVAELPILCEYCIPFVKVGGCFIAYKGKSAEEELNSSSNAIKLLGCETQDIFPVNLPQTDAQRSIIVIRKTKSTPTQYPRRMAKISKSPL